MAKKSEQEWRAVLTPEQFRILREKVLWNARQLPCPGVCAACQHAAAARTNGATEPTQTGAASAHQTQ